LLAYLNQADVIKVVSFSPCFCAPRPRALSLELNPQSHGDLFVVVVQACIMQGYFRAWTLVVNRALCCCSLLCINVRGVGQCYFVG